MNDRKATERMREAVRLWCREKGYEQINDVGTHRLYTDFAAAGKGETVGFIFEFDKDEKEFSDKLIFSRDLNDKRYVVIDDSVKRRSVAAKLPESIGILCYSDSFGLGYVFQEFRPAS